MSGPSTRSKKTTIKFPRKLWETGSNSKRFDRIANNAVEDHNHVDDSQGILADLLMQHATTCTLTQPSVRVTLNLGWEL